MTSRSRKDKESSPLIFWILPILGFIILALTAIGLVALYGAWIYFEWKARKNPSSINDIATSHTIKEKVEMHVLEKELTKLNVHFDSLKEMAVGLARRNDGAFDGRSADGKMLNVEWPKTEEKIQFVSGKLDQLEKAPSIRIDEWISLRSFLSASRVTAIAYPIITITVTLMKQEGAQAVSKIIEKNTGGALFGVESLYGSLTTSLLIAAVLFFAIKMMSAVNLRRGVTAQTELS